MDYRAELGAVLDLDGEREVVNDLVRRCTGGEHAAWSALFTRFQARLKTRVRVFLRGQGGDSSLVDEIAAQVWLVLLQRDARLLRQYQPDRSFLAFLASIARYETLVRFRSERRRRGRENGERRASINGGVILPEYSRVELEEFLASLTPRERDYLERELISAAAHGNGGAQPGEDLSLTRANHWQLRHRIRRKLRQYLEW